MRHFLKVADSIDVYPLLTELYQQPGLWNQHTFRQTTPGSPQTEVDDILLRMQPLDGSEADKRECVTFAAWHALPQVRPLVFGLMARVEGERLGRVMITRLAPGHRIPPHADVGPYAVQYDTVRYYSRFHIVLQADAGSLFRAEDEVTHMAPGTCWWFDNAVEHEVWNDGALDRLHLIIDIHTASSPR
jgi:hypothetical protein